MGKLTASATANDLEKAPIKININGSEKLLKDVDLEDIMKYCVNTGNVAWLQETANTDYPVKAYPRKLVEQRDKEGNVIYKTKKNKKTGEIEVTNVPRMRSIVDKTAAKVPTGETRKASFVEIKSAFVEKFFPEAKATKEETMFDKIMKLQK